MAIGWIIVQATVASTLLAAAAAAVPGPKEPLVVTQMADPDRYFVARRTDDAGDNARIEGAMQSFGRALQEAALITRQQMQAKCSHGQHGAETPEQRFAWAAGCGYSRH